MDCSPPGSSVHGISQARILKWVAISFSRGSSWLKNQTRVSCIGRQIPYHWATREAPIYFKHSINSVYISISISQFLPSCSFSLGFHTYALYVCVSTSALQIRSSIPFSWVAHMCMKISCLFFSFWLTSLYMTVSRSIHVSANGTISFPFMPE